MLLRNHIAYRFLTDDTLAFEIVEQTHFKEVKSIINREVMDNVMSSKVRSMWHLVNKDNQKTYLVTDSVHDKLDMLKIKLDEDGHYDFTVFNKIPSGKSTFILKPNKEFGGGGVLRILVSGSTIEFCHLCYKFKEGSKEQGTALWTFFYIDRVSNTHAAHCEHQNVKDIYDFVYKLMCFIFLSENEEEVIKVGEKKGTRKQGKIINILPFPLIVVNSRWNITSIRTEGFDVSGHFRLQPTKTGTKMIFINPFSKHGYIRRAKSENL